MSDFFDRLKQERRLLLLTFCARPLFVSLSPDLLKQQEIKRTVHRDPEYFPQMEIVLCRYDGTDRLATVGGERFALIARSKMVT